VYDGSHDSVEGVKKILSFAAEKKRGRLGHGR